MSENTKSVTYYAKVPVTCPVCKHTFKREDLLTGGGRIIAGDLTDELRRTYEPTAKYGKIFPFLYAIGACPLCYSAFFWNDFAGITNTDTLNRLFETIEFRKKAVSTIFPHCNLTDKRTVFDGTAIHYLALLTYDTVSVEYSPTIKRAITSLRLAWLCGDLNTEYPNHNYDFIQQVFYRKALFFYREMTNIETEATENAHATFTNFGPDIDKNYGYDGILYLCGLLEYKYGQQEDMSLRINELNTSKRTLARIFGMGRTSKKKPGPLLEHAHRLYESLRDTIRDANMPDIDPDDDGEDADN